MEAGLELDDDVFFKDLSKQISLLIMDDDDDEDSLTAHRPSANLQAYNQDILHPARQASFVNYDHHHHHQTSKRDQSKGTGVFIPRSSSNPRRKNVNKQGRFTSASGSKPHQISRSDPNMGYSNYSNINQSHDHSFNQVRRL